MKELFFPLTMIVISTLATPAFAKDKLPTNAVNAIEQTLTKYYGNQYQNDCLFFSHDETHYCAKVTNAEIKTLNGKSQLYVLVNGDYAEPELDAGHVTEGIGGLFIFNQVNNQWQLAATQPYITNGAYGSSQLGNFKLVQIAPDKFGWYGEYGYTSTGCTEVNKHIYAQVGNQIKAIFMADPLDSDCSGNGDGWDSYESKLTILSQKSAINGFYPIQINAIEHDYPDNHNVKKGKVKESNYQMTYKPSAQKYIR